ncbi:MAG: recombination regulator RecX [Methylophilaceae bacterium]
MTSNPPVTLRQRALNCLARREHSRLELGRKLKPFVEEGDDLVALLDDFQKRGWISDQRFAEMVVHAKSGRYGKLKVAHELREKGVAEDLVTQAVDALDDVQSAKMVWQKKYGVHPENREAWAKQARFLQSRGFGFDVIKKVLAATNDDDQ